MSSLLGRSPGGAGGGSSSLDDGALSPAASVTLNSRPSLEANPVIAGGRQHSCSTTALAPCLGLIAPPPLGASDSIDADVDAVMAEAGGSLTTPLLSADGGSGGFKAGEQPHARIVADEALRLLRLALPLALQQLSVMLLGFISTVAVGHLNDPVALGAVVLSSSLYNISGMSVNIGLASAMDTVCGQAFGARNYALLGVAMQRARLICWTASLPIAASWWFAEPLLLLLGQEPELSRLAARNLRILCPALFLGVVNDTTRRYLVAQRDVLPTSVSYLATTLLAPLWNWLFIYKLELRAAGAATAMLCCTFTNCLALVGYQTWRDARRWGTPTATWAGWSRQALKGWRSWLRIALPAAAMIVAEWWLWEVLVVIAGWLPDGSLSVGVMGLCISATNIAYMVPSSLGSAASVRVSNMLGAGEAVRARAAAWVAVAAALALTFAMGAALFAGRALVARVFTTDPIILAATAAVMPAVAASVVGDGMVATLSGVMRASGRQSIGAALNLCGYWGIALPTAVALGWGVPALGIPAAGVRGFWLALAGSTVLQAATFAALISRYDWRREVLRARSLVGRATASG